MNVPDLPDDLRQHVATLALTLGPLHTKQKTALVNLMRLAYSTGYCEGAEYVLTRVRGMSALQTNKETL